MLAHLHIRNLAVIDEIELELGQGLTVLTGETGAGKSILVDALALALGERADSQAIRTGTDRCEITATFDLSQRANVKTWLSENDLDENSDCILRRVVTTEGRSRGYVNGRTVPMQTLRELGEQLVDICGQQTHHSLRHAQVQRDILDQVGKHDKLLESMGKSHHAWQQTRTKFDALSAALEDRLARQDLLSYQVSELEALNVHNGEYQELEQEHRLVANASRIADGISAAVQLLYESDQHTAQAAISTAKRELNDLASLDATLDTTVSMLSEAEILVTEASDALKHRLDGLEHDPKRQAQLEQRIAGILELARKHGVSPDELPALAQNLAQELADLEDSDERLAELSAEIETREKNMTTAAKKLTSARKKAASSLGSEVMDTMHQLGMPDGRFAIEIQPNQGGKISAIGADRIEFGVAANAGHDPGPLAKVASGGELSRISLAIQVVALAADAVPTLIFDEVDAGVGGGVAEMVGSRLEDLSGQRQVLCVTHLPQVASQANQHLRVTKISDGVSTRTSVNQLTTPERVEEIARMLGGIKITSRTRAHAEEMLRGNRSRQAG